MSILPILKKIPLSKSIFLLVGGIVVVSVALTNIFVLHDKAANLESTKQMISKPSPTITPTPTGASDSSTTTTKNNYATPTIVLTTTPTVVPTQATNETLKIDSAEPNFLWANYGSQYVHVRGSGFTTQTRFELIVTSLGAPFPSDMGKSYPVGNVSLPSSHEFYGTIPPGLYNSYYKLRAIRSDGATAETGAFLVVSGNTQAQGEAPYPTYDPSPTVVTPTTVVPTGVVSPTP